MLAKGANSAASCVCSINNGTGEGYHQYCFHWLELRAAQMVTDKRIRGLCDAFGDKLPIAANCSHSQANGDTYAACPDCFQDTFLQ